MSNIDIFKVILSHIGEDPAQDRALAQGCIVILEGAESEPTPSKDKPKAEAKKPAPKKRKPFDTGKMKACLNAGRSVAWIAEEMGCSVGTIYDHMKKEGLAVGKVKED